MALTVYLMGASYSDVPSIVVPSDSNGGASEFYDITDAETALGSDGTETLEDSITALTTYSNEITGASDTTLSAAVATLASGYGGGSGYSVDDLAANLPSGEITLGNGVTTIKKYAFYGKPITSISGSAVTLVEADALAYTSITSITDSNFPALTTGRSYFNYMPSMTSIKLSRMRDLSSGSAQVRGCTALVTAEFPACTSVVGRSCFYGDSVLELVDIGFATQIGATGFYNCNKLQTLILRNTSGICALNNVNAFTNTPFRGYGSLTGVVYVPSALISTYEAATNWRTLVSAGYCSFSAIERSDYE